MSDRVIALRHCLQVNGLIGKSAFKFGSPDEVVFVSGGPKSHLSNASIICGPSSLRVVIRQPSKKIIAPKTPHSPLSGEIYLKSEKIPFTASIEQWQHGSWYHSNSIKANNISDLLEQLKRWTPNENFGGTPSEFAPKRPFWAGCFAYDMVQWTQPLELQNPPNEGEIITMLWLIDKYVLHSKKDDSFEAFSKDGKWLSNVNKIIKEDLENIQLTVQPENKFEEYSTHTDIEHSEIIERIKSSILDGQVYQVNFGRFWSGRLVEEPSRIFLRLLKSNPAPFSNLIHAEDLGISIISSTPESLLKCQDGQIRTSPIKGTYENGSNAAETGELRQKMVADVKERSEHRMLVDLMRNDLSAVCEVGSVEIERFDVEAYANVQHLVSHLKGKLLDSESGLTALNSIFPGGSITGCPRTMVCAAIDEIEKHSRSFWTGSAGWIDVHSGDGSWNILIRTVQAERKDGKWFGKVGSGGGITIRSIAELEVRETYWKASPLRSACGWNIEEEIDGLKGELSIHPLEIEQWHNNSIGGKVNSFRQWKNSTDDCGVLLIDNLDSFTLNIAHSIAGMGHNVTILDGRGILADELSDPTALCDILELLTPSHIIIGPGPGNPNDSLLSKAISAHALANQINCSVLGICLGHQSIAEMGGGTIVKSPNGPVHGTPIICHHEQNGIFEGLNSPQSFTRYNSLTVNLDENNSDLSVTARDENGEIMALQHNSLPIFSVQFHPESIGSPTGKKLLENFLEFNRMLE
jgi:anthranilate synthase/aminodeoxychorismate synthase-like glutamine amidotransferase